MVTREGRTSVSSKIDFDMFRTKLGCKFGTVRGVGKDTHECERQKILGHSENEIGTPKYPSGHTFGTKPSGHTHNTDRDTILGRYFHFGTPLRDSTNSPSPILWCGLCKTPINILTVHKGT